MSARSTVITVFEPAARAAARDRAAAGRFYVASVGPRLAEPRSCRRSSKMKWNSIRSLQTILSNSRSHLMISKRVHVERLWRLGRSH